MAVTIKRVYDAPSPDDGFRVLVDRLWPRGLTRERAAVDHWAKDAAPSTELRRAYHRDGLPWEDFASAYRVELAANPAVDALRDELSRHPVATLLYSVHDAERNHAAVLLDVLEA
ncbi:DUF488 domain-containing protein [Microbacterium sulfonylureivorans]|uniref:DUF488 domain-containing protein n=1 Tax=Microbacterium sulfonylureivorans TaxID=2486854 RepID=UPI000FDB5540|nr:DUF488 family protein [Microbacterium sulfonylureivorans]